MSPEDIQQHSERVKTDGYTIVEGAIDPEFCDEIRTGLERLEEELAVKPASNIFEGLATIRIYNLLARGKLYEAIPVHENVLPVVEKVLDRGCLVSSLSSIAICPNESPQPLHADDQVLPLPKPHIPVICNSMWAITDFTEENGATRLVKGSHLRDSSPEFGVDYPSEPAAMKKGSVLIWNGSLWHGGGANRTSERRIGIAMNYCAGWLRQQENQQLGIPLSTARGFAPRLRKLVGYGIYRGLMGHIDKCSPEDLLDGCEPRRVVGEVGG